MTYMDDIIEAVALPKAYIVWTMPGGQEILSVGPPGVKAEDLARSVIEDGIRPEGTPWLEVDADYVVPASMPELAAQARAKRDRLLAETDYLMMPDYPADKDIKAAVQKYRTALRDITGQADFPAAIEWPEKPEGV